MTIDIQNPAFLYNLFFSLAHIVSWIILIWYGQRHKYPILQWLLIIVTGYIFFTIGSHVLAVNAASLKMLINGEGWPVSEGKSLVSGLLLAIPAMLLLKHILRFEYKIFEPYAITLPLGIAIQRMGCLAAGCCYGNATDLPWGVSYNYGHLSHYKQWEQGLITNNELQSIPVHPVQIYEGMLCLVIVAIILYLYKRKWMQDQLIYTSLFLYFIARFITEFFRDDAAHTIGLNSYLGLNTVQWIMMVFSLLLLYVLTKKKKKPLINQSTDQDVKYISFKEYAWFILLFGLILTTPKFYSSLELLLLGIVLIPLSALIFWQFFKPVKSLKIRLATTVIFVLAFFSISQNSPVVQGDTIEKTKNKYHKISIGGYYGSNSMTYYTKGCDGSKTKQSEFKDKYYLVGAGYSYVKEISDEKKLTVGIGASYGRINEEANLTYYGSNNRHVENNIGTYAFSPFIKYDIKRVGIGAGILVGDISVYRPESYQILEQYNILPQFHLRYGNLKKVWTELNYGTRFPGISPATEFEWLLGIRGKQGNLVRFGTSAQHALVVRPEFYINDNIAIEPFFGIGGAMFSNSFSDRKGIEGGLNLHYMINQNDQKKPID